MYTDNWVPGALVMVIIVQVWGKYMIIVPYTLHPKPLGEQHSNPCLELQSDYNPIRAVLIIHPRSSPI